MNFSRLSSTLDPTLSDRLLNYRAYSVFNSNHSLSPCFDLSSSSISTNAPFESWKDLRETQQLEQEEDSKEKTMGLILKAYDDCRQDTLALQVMHLLETIWESEGIDIPLMVYNVTPARTSDEHKAMGGIIECVGVSFLCLRSGS